MKKKKEAMYLPDIMLTVESKKIEQVSITASNLQEALAYCEKHNLRVDQVIPQPYEKAGEEPAALFCILAKRDVALVEA